MLLIIAVVLVIGLVALVLAKGGAGGPCRALTMQSYTGEDTLTPEEYTASIQLVDALTGEMDVDIMALIDYIGRI